MTITGPFRFTDANPYSNGTYAQSMFRNLPEQVAYVVTELCGVPRSKWDELVEEGEVFNVVSPLRVYRVTGQGVSAVVDASCSSCAGSGQRARSATGHCQSCGGSGEVALLGESATRAAERAEALTYLARNSSAVAA